MASFNMVAPQHTDPRDQLKVVTKTVAKHVQQLKYDFLLIH